MVQLKEFTLITALILALSMLFSCNAEDIIEPADPVEPVNPTSKYVTIPVSFNLSTPKTKVVLDEVNNKYQFEDGDVMYFSNATFGISGYVEYDASAGSGQHWNGKMKYGASYDFDTQIKSATLSAVLVGPATDDTFFPVAEDTDLEHGFPTAMNSPVYSGAVASSLTEAIRAFSYFTTSFTYAQATSSTANYIALSQQSSFIDFSVTFEGYIGEMTTGNTPVTMVTSDGGGAISIAGSAEIIKVNDVFNATFTTALPGGTVLDNATFTICEREVDDLTSKNLEANTVYHVTRTLDMSPQLGDPFWSDGTYGRISHADGVVVTGIIVFVNNYEDSDLDELANEARAMTEKGSGYGHALVMSLKNAGTNVKWSTASTLNGTAITSPSQILGSSNYGNMSGYSNTITLIANAANIAAVTARNYRSSEGDTMTGTSGWFLPSISQWVYSISIRGFGGADYARNWIVNETYVNWLTKGTLSNLVLVKNNGSVSENLLVTSLNDRMQALYVQYGCEYDSFGMYSGSDFADNYWSSSEYNASNAIRMNFGSVETRTDTGDKYSSIKTNNLSKQSTYAWKSAFVMKVRPFLAF